MRKTRFGWLECIVGVLMVMLGIFTWAKPVSAIHSFTRIYGMAAAISGMRDLVFYCKAERYAGFCPMVSLTAGIVSLMTGVVLFVYPEAGTVIVTILVPIWFLSHSIFQITSLERIKYFTDRSYYHFACVIGIIGLILSIVMLFSFRVSIITISIIVGCYLIMTGIASIVLAFSHMGFER